MIDVGDKKIHPAVLIEVCGVDPHPGAWAASLAVGYARGSSNLVELAAAAVTYRKFCTVSLATNRSMRPSLLMSVATTPQAFPRKLPIPEGRSSLFGILQHDYGVELAYADEEIDATAAEASIAELLGVPRGASVLRIRQVIYSTKGKATIYGVGFYRSERHTLFIRRFR
ncbi:MAG: UTRA domain-containing protein [Candidatus Sulfotelmatobacter sp.]